MWRTGLGAHEVPSQPCLKGARAAAVFVSRGPLPFSSTLTPAVQPLTHTPPVLLVPAGAKLGALKITADNKQLLRSGYTRRRPEELPVLTRYSLVAAGKCPLLFCRGVVIWSSVVHVTWACGGVRSLLIVRTSSLLKPPIVLPAHNRKLSHGLQLYLCAPAGGFLRRLCSLFQRHSTWTSFCIPGSS